MEEPDSQFTRTHKHAPLFLMLISKHPSVHMFSACRSHLVPSGGFPNFDSVVWGPGCATGDDATGVADPVPLFYTVVLHSLCSLLDKDMRVGLGEQKRL